MADREKRGLLMVFSGFFGLIATGITIFILQRIGHVRILNNEWLDAGFTILMMVFLCLLLCGLRKAAGSREAAGSGEEKDENRRD